MVTLQKRWSIINCNMILSGANHTNVLPKLTKIGAEDGSVSVLA